MEILVAREFETNYAKLSEKIKDKFEKKERIFKSNPFHSSLHTEKLAPKVKQVWSFRIDKKYRIIFQFISKDKVVFLNIGHHHWIYRINF